MSADLATYDAWGGVDTSTSTTMTLTTPEDYPAGTLLCLATTRSTLGTVTNGVRSITGIGGASWVLNVASACRSGTHDLGGHYILLEEDVPAGTNFTVTWLNQPNRKVGICKPIGGMDGTYDITTGNNAYDTLGNVNSNYNGSGTSASISAANIPDLTEDDQVLISIFATPLATVTPGTGWTAALQLDTDTGSGDRQLYMQYKTQALAGDTGAANCSFGATSGGWAGIVFSLKVEGVSGTTHSVTITDNVGITDEGAEEELNVEEVLTESIAVTDNIAVQATGTYTVDIIESIGIVDSMDESATQTFEVIITEDIGITDDIAFQEFLLEFDGSIADQLDGFLRAFDYTEGSLHDRMWKYLHDLAGNPDGEWSIADLQFLLGFTIRDVMFPTDGL